VVDKSFLNNKINTKMKGISWEVVVIIAAVIVIIIALFAFSGWFGTFNVQTSGTNCKSQLQNACSSFRSTGNPAVFNGIPQTCADSLGVSSLFKACVSGTTDQCKSLCESVEIGVVTPQGGGEIPSPTGGEVPSPTLPPVGQ